MKKLLFVLLSLSIFAGCTPPPSTELSRKVTCMMYNGETLVVPDAIVIKQEPAGVVLRSKEGTINLAGDCLVEKL